MNNIEQLLVYEEGEVLHAYQDHLGYWTIGVGIMVDQRLGGAITTDESRYLLRNRIDANEAALARALPWFCTLDDVRRAVLISLSYQVGLSGALRFPKTLAHMEHRRWKEASIEFMDSTLARQTPLRAQRAAKMLETGLWPGQT